MNYKSKHLSDIDEIFKLHKIDVIKEIIEYLSINNCPYEIKLIKAKYGIQ